MNYRAICTSEPTQEQIRTLWSLMEGARMVAVATAAQVKGHAGDVESDLAKLTAELEGAIAGNPVPESTARMVAAAFQTVGCGATVVSA